MISAEALLAGATVLQAGTPPSDPAAAFGTASQAMQAGLELLEANDAPDELVATIRSSQLAAKLNGLLLDLKALGSFPLKESDVALHGGFIPSALEAAAAGASFLDALTPPAPDPAPTPSEPSPAPDPAPGTSPVPAQG